MDVVKRGPNPILLQLENLVAVVIVLVVNTLANTLPFNNVTTVKVADSYPNLFTPPGYVFAIWGVIYLLAALFALFQLRPSQRGERYLRSISWLYLASALLNSTWLTVFHYSYGAPMLYIVSTLLLLLLLYDLIQIYRRLDIGGVDAHHGEKICVHIPISVYLSWVSVASIAGIASAINIIVPDIPMGVQVIGTVGMLVVVFCITVYMLWIRRDLFFALVIVWAVLGIAGKQTEPIIHLTALVVMGLAFTAAILTPNIRRMSWRNYYLS